MKGWNRHGKRKNKGIQKGEIIFRQGDAEFWMYDILSGGVAIYAEHGTEDEKLLVELGAARHFGELGLIECYPRSATAVSLEKDTQLKMITVADFSEYLKNKPAKVLIMMQ
ncbi:MAG: cyclic nucleotide-binding domain-containing protein [Clostridia bacterium]|nr:cyclic nucleotide-binding domain-containing protein [Clostridia bacterium]